MNNISLARLKSSTLQKFSQLKPRTWTSNLECFLYKNLFFFVKLNRFLYIWVLKCKISACRFLNHYVLIRGLLLYCLDWLPPHTVLQLFDTSTWFLSVWWEVHQTSEDSANLLSFLPLRKGDRRRQTFSHAFMNTQYLILVIRSCKLETVLTCLILGRVQ